MKTKNPKQKILRFGKPKELNEHSTNSVEENKLKLDKLTHQIDSWIRDENNRSTK